MGREGCFGLETGRTGQGRAELVSDSVAWGMIFASLRLLGRNGSSLQMVSGLMNSGSIQ